jgi:hypothetical protein
MLARSKASKLELEEREKEFQTQQILPETARDVFDQMKMDGRGNRRVLMVEG